MKNLIRYFGSGRRRRHRRHLAEGAAAAIKDQSQSLNLPDSFPNTNLGKQPAVGGAMANKNSHRTAPCRNNPARNLHDLLAKFSHSIIVIGVAVTLQVLFVASMMLILLVGSRLTQG